MICVLKPFINRSHTGDIIIDYENGFFALFTCIFIKTARYPFYKFHAARICLKLFYAGNGKYCRQNALPCIYRLPF